MSKTFVKLSEDQQTYVVFKNPVSDNGTIRFVNSDAGKNALGYFELDTSYPQVEEGYHVVRTAWRHDEALNKIVGVFDIVEDEKVPRTFSKYKLMTCFMEKGMWEQVKAWIQSSGYSDFWDVPLEFDESDPYFKLGLEAFCKQFSMSEQEIEEILQACVKDTM